MLYYVFLNLFVLGLGTTVGYMGTNYLYFRKEEILEEPKEMHISELTPEIVTNLLEVKKG